MRIHVNTSLAGGEDKIRHLLPKTSAALDGLWQKKWIKDASFGNALPDLVKKLDRGASEMRFRCDRIAILACGASAMMVDGMLDYLDLDGLASAACTKEMHFGAKDQRKRVFSVDETFSASMISRILSEIEEHNSGIIVLAIGEESLAQRTAYAIFKKALSDRYGQEHLSERICVITDGRSEYFAEEIEQCQLSVETISSDASFFDLASTPAQLFPMLSCGADAEAFVEGFREMVSSTWWDQDADRYALFLAAQESQKEDICYWQPQLSGAAHWLAFLHRLLGIDARALYCPKEVYLRRGDAFQTTLLLSEETVDILLPIFPGANEEGSLNCQLLAESEQEQEEREGITISIQESSLEGYGELVAFLQMSCGIMQHAMEG